MSQSPTDVIRLLLAGYEEMLSEEFSSDGNEHTGFARGWLGMPLPKKRSENPHRLTKYHEAGKLAREEWDDYGDDSGCIEPYSEALRRNGYHVS